MEKIVAKIRKIIQQAGSILAGYPGPKLQLRPAPARVARADRFIRRR